MCCVLVYRLRQKVTHRISVVVFLHQRFGISMWNVNLLNTYLVTEILHHRVWRLMKSVEFLCHFYPQVTIGVNGYHTLGMSRTPSVDAAEGIDSETLKAWGVGRCIPISSQVRDLWERRKLPQRGPEQSLGRNWILHNLNTKEAIWWHVLHWIFYVTGTLKLCSCAWYKKFTPYTGWPKTQHIFKKLRTRNNVFIVSLIVWSNSHAAVFLHKCSMCSPCCGTTHSSRRHHWPIARSVKRCNSLFIPLSDDWLL